MGNRDYYTTRGYQRPDRPDSGHRMLAIGILVALLVIGGLVLWG